MGYILCVLCIAYDVSAAQMGKSSQLYPGAELYSILRSVVVAHLGSNPQLLAAGLSKELRQLNCERGIGVNRSSQATADMLTFLYPYGATLQVQKPANAVLSSGTVSLPVNRPVCAFYEDTKKGGRLAVLGW
jgi:intraflagellar transport protein 52